MDITGTKLTSNTAVKMAEPTDVPGGFTDPSRKQAKYAHQREDDGRAAKIELSQRSASKMLQERKSCLIKNREQPAPGAQLSLAGVKMNQLPNELVS